MKKVVDNRNQVKVHIIDGRVVLNLTEAIILKRTKEIAYYNGLSTD